MSRDMLVAVLAPSLLGLLAAASITQLLSPEPVFVLRLQLPSAGLPVVAGFVVSIVVVGLQWMRHRREAVVRDAVAEERKRTDAAHKRFVHRLNHELKNPLTAVRAGLANLGKDDSSPGRQTSLGNVRHQVERLARLSEDLRKLADLEASALDCERVDLEEVIAEAVGLAASVPGREVRQVRVQIQKVPWPVSPVQGDPDLLLLAIYNLVDNALKFSRPEDMVELRVNEDGIWVGVEVADTGLGISEEDLPHVTEELYRGQDVQGVEGSGLGLALVERIAALHGGRLVIRSRRGQGTVTTIRLPIRGK